MSPLPLRVKAILSVVIAFAVVAIVAGGVFAKVAFDQRDEALRKSTGAATQNKSAAQDACGQVERLGKKCVVDADELKSGKQSIQGVQGLQGIPGVPGTPGRSGTDGAEGRPGAASTVPGPTGPAGQPGVAGQRGADGQDGADGKDGADGAPGRGIAQVMCEALVGTKFVIVYDDGTQQEVVCTAP